MHCDRRESSALKDLKTMPRGGVVVLGARVTYDVFPRIGWPDGAILMERRVTDTVQLVYLDSEPTVRLLA